jgi:hypothetical protein
MPISNLLNIKIKVIYLECPDFLRICDAQKSASNLTNVRLQIACYYQYDGCKNYAKAESWIAVQ